jgi:hypothetical protein
MNYCHSIWTGKGCWDYINCSHCSRYIFTTFICKHIKNKNAWHITSLECKAFLSLMVHKSMVHQCFCNQKKKSFNEHKTNEVLKSIWERMKLSTFKNTLLNKKCTFAYIMARLRIHIQRKKGRWHKIHKTFGLKSSFLDVKCWQWCWWVEGGYSSSQSHTKLVLPLPRD